jgi:hypothetical protein
MSHDLHAPFFTDHPAKAISDFTRDQIQRSQRNQDPTSGTPFSDPGISTSPVVRSFGTTRSAAAVSGAPTGAVQQAPSSGGVSSSQAITYAPEVLRGLRVWLTSADPSDPSKPVNLLFIEEGAVRFSDGTIRVFSDDASLTYQQIIDPAYSLKAWHPSGVGTGSDLISAYTLGEDDGAGGIKPSYAADTAYEMSVSPNGLAWQKGDLARDVVWIASIYVPGADAPIRAHMAHDRRVVEATWAEITDHDRLGARRLEGTGSALPGRGADDDYLLGRVPHAEVFDRKFAELRPLYARASTPSAEPIPAAESPGFIPGEGLSASIETRNGLPCVRIGLAIGHTTDAERPRTGTLTFDFTGDADLEVSQALPDHCAGKTLTFVLVGNTTGRAVGMPLHQGNVISVRLPREYETGLATPNTGGHSHGLTGGGATDEAVVPYPTQIAEKPATGQVSLRWILLD